MTKIILDLADDIAGRSCRRWPGIASNFGPSSGRPEANGMLLESVAHKGSWWVAGSDQRVPGVLEYSPERGTRLTLNGTFESKTFRSFGGAEVRHEIILGTTSLGKHITMVDCE